MASVGVTARHTTVTLHAVAAEARAQKQESAAWSGRGGVAWRGGGRALASSTASEGEQRNGSHGQSVPKLERFNQSRLSRLLRQPSLLEKAAHELARGACYLKATRRFDAGKRCLSLRILRRHTRSSVIRQLVTVVQARAVLWSGLRTWSDNQVVCQD